MSIRSFFARVRGLFWRSASDRALAREIDNHLHLETQRNIALGMSRDEARRAARLAFGSIESVKEEYRDHRGVRWIEETVSDVRYALRTLRRNPAHAAAAIITLALGVGVNTAIFSVVHSVVLRPLPFPAPDRLMMLSEENPERHWHHQFAANANYLDWRARVHAFEDVAAYQAFGGGVPLTGEGQPTMLQVATVTGNFMSVIGGRAELGRALDSAETWAGGTPVVVISHGLWQSRFGGRPDIIGRMINLGGVPTQVVGVMPASFTFPFGKIDGWSPIGWKRESVSLVSFRRAHGMRVIARLKPRITYAKAMAEFQDVVHQLQKEYPATNRVMGADMTPLHDFLIGDVRTPLLVLQGAVIMLLLIACANVGNLLLVMAAAREREAALRLTLGASVSRLVRQVLTESVTLGAIGGAAGLILGLWGLRLLLRVQPQAMTPVGAIHLDWWVFAYTLGIVAVSACLFAAAPALWNRRQAPAQSMRDGGRSASAGRTRRLWSRALVVAEIGLALLLTSGAGLLLRSFERLLSVDPGFSPHGVLAVTLQISGRDYDTDAQQKAFFDQVLERIRAIPGVDHADQALLPPMRGTGYTSDYHTSAQAPDKFGIEIGHNFIGTDYLATMRIPLIAGRNFNAADVDTINSVVMINQALAREGFPGKDPIGQRITFDRHPDSTSRWYIVVGVMGDVRQKAMGAASQIEAMVPFAESVNSYQTLVIHTPTGDPLRLVPGIRAAIASVDRNVPIATIDTMDSLVAASIATQRFLMLLLLAFGGTGLLLAIVGVYGVMAQAARSRTREIGIRVALGAPVRGVQWLVVREGLVLAGAGAFLGLAGALFMSRVIASVLYEVSPQDPLTLIAVTTTLVTTAAAAAWIPARGVSRTDPAIALRGE